MNVDDLHTYLFDGQPHTLSPQMLNWLTSSRRFAGFVSAAGSKIRKKLRAAQEPESAADLLLELQTAYLLLQERALSVVYEPQASGQPRRPDFAVSFTTHSTFILEVTRLRLQAEPTPFKSERLADTVRGKLGQLLPGRSNVLLIGTPAPVTEGDLRAVMVELQRRAERGDTSLFGRFQDRGDFFRHYGQLSEVLIRSSPGRAGDLTVWVNPQARHPLPGKVRTALYRSQV